MYRSADDLSPDPTNSIATTAGAAFLWLSDVPTYHGPLIRIVQTRPHSNPSIAVSSQTIPSVILE